MLLYTGGAHASIPKFVFSMEGTMYDYTCTTSKTAGRRNLKDDTRHLKEDDRLALYKKHAAANSPSLEVYKEKFYAEVTKSCESCDTSSMRSLLADKLLDTKLRFLQKATE